MERDTGKRVAGGKPQKQPKQKKPKKPSRLTRQQKILIVVAVILAIVLVVVVACQSLFVRPDVTKPKEENDTEKEEIDYGDGVRPRSDGERKSEDWYTILVLGRDTGGGGNCDTMMLVSYDVTNQKMTVMNIPRDTMVNVSWDVKKINSVYNNYGGGEKGIQALYKEISQLVGFEPDYQVIVEWEAVGELVDAIGGVWFDVPRDMDYEDPYQDLSIHIDKGYQLLNGEQAMGVVRFRDGKNGYNNGDIGRIETQQAFLKAVLEQLLQVKNVTKINQFAKVFEENVETDLTVQNLFWFGQQAIFGGLDVNNVNFVTMPYKGVYAWSRYYQQNLSYVVPVADELLELVNNEISPFVEPFTMSDLDIMSVNSDGSISSSTGHVEDSKAAQPPVKPSKPTTPEPETPTVDENGNPIDPGTTTPEGGTSGGDTGTTTPEGGTSGGDTGTTTPEGGTSGGDTGTTTPEGGTSGGDTGTTTPEGGTSGGTGTTTPDGSTATGGDTGSTTTPEGGTATGGDTGSTTTPPDFSIIDPAPAG